MGYVIGGSNGSTQGATQNPLGHKLPPLFSGFNSYGQFMHVWVYFIYVHIFFSIIIWH